MINVTNLLQTEYQQGPKIDLKGHTLEELASFANVSVDVIKLAVRMRQQQMMEKNKDSKSSSKPPEQNISYRSKVVDLRETKNYHKLKNHKVSFC